MSMISDMTDNQQDLRVVSAPKSIDSSCQACDGSFSNEVKVPRQPGHLETALLQLELLPVAELEKRGFVCSLQESCVCSPYEAHPRSSRNASEKASSERILCTDGNGNERRCQKRRSKRRLLGGKRASSENALVVDDKAETNRIDTTQYVRRSDSNLVGSSTEQKDGCGNGGCVVVKDRRSMLKRSRNTRRSSPRRQLLNKSPSKRKSKWSLKDPTNSAFNDSIHSNTNDAKDADEPADRSSVRRSSMPGHTVTSLVNAPDLNSMEHKPPSDKVHVGGEMDSLSNLLIKSCSTDSDRPQVSPLRRSRNTRRSSPRRQLLNKSPSKRKSKRSLKDPTNSAFNDSIHSNTNDANDPNEPADRSSVRRSSMPGHTVTSLVNAPDLNIMEHKPPSDKVHVGDEMDSLSNLLIKSCSTDNDRPQVSPVYQSRHSAHLQKAASERSLFLSHHNDIHRNIMFDKKGTTTRSCAMTKQQFFMGYSNLGSSASTTQWDL